MNIDEIYFAALEFDDSGSRAAYLDEACGLDPELRRRVERLLDARSERGSFLEAPAAGPSRGPDWSPALEDLGTVIGPYKLLEVIGEGGMGVVYMAEQAQPVRRKVALKIIKPGMDTKQVIARFEAERQALALMDHPNIARVLDAGATESGLPYFVMELVRGISITDYCDQHRLSIDDRLALFVLVCNAVQHAHQKGIIHRDIKPSNVLITLHDGVPVPKVIDFGIAKAISQPLTEKTLITGFAQLIGTPLYMSPEQAELGGIDVDTRSDIYSLGVLLYELLAGTTPFDEETFRRAAFDEVRRIIREQEPPSPSTRLSSLGATLTTVSANRQTDARKLNRALHCELDWITMKALEKDRRQRYETASAFAADIDRFRSDQPVKAVPPSAWYRLRKSIRRNRVALTTTALVALALVSGTAVSTWQAIRARKAERISQEQRDRAEANFQRAREAVDKLLTEVGNSGLVDVPQMEPVRRRLLESALEFYQGFLLEKGNEPAIRFEVGRAYDRLANLNSQLGRHEQAEESARHAVEMLARLSEEFPKETVYRGRLGSFLANLGVDLAAVGRIEEAERSFRRSFDVYAPLVSGPAAQAEDRRQVANAHNLYGNMLLGAGRLEEARAEYQESLALGEKLAAEKPDDADLRMRLGGTLSNTAVVEARQGHLEEARRLLDRAIAHQQTALKADPKDRRRRLFLGQHYSNMVSILTQLGNPTEALENHRRAIAISEDLARDFPGVPDYRFGLAIDLMNLGTLIKGTNAAEAEESYRRALSMFGYLVAEFPAVTSYRQELAGCGQNLGSLLFDGGRPREALPILRQTHELYQKLADASGQAADYSKELDGVRTDLARLLVADPDPADQAPAEALRLAEALIRQNPSDPSRQTLLAAARYRSGDYRGSIKSMNESLRLQPRENGDLIWLALARARLGETVQARSDYDRASAWIDANAPSARRSNRLRAEAAALLGLPVPTPPQKEVRPTPED